MSGRTVADLSQLPRVADGWTFLYADKVRIRRSDYAIELVDKSGRIAVPCAALSVLVLGTGSTITHAAVLALAEVGCSIVWSGEDMVRFYASGLGETRRAHHIEAQARAWASEAEHIAVVRRMYLQRFPEHLPEDLTIEQIRGREGVRVREAYAALSRETGVAWNGRSYRRGDWAAADPINRALSAANACLYGVCHAAIVATGFTPALGFIHVGKQLSFVYDIADLYKVDIVIPAAFRTVQAGEEQLESRVRRMCRELFTNSRLLERIVPDMQRVLGLAAESARLIVHRGDSGDPEKESPEEGLGEEPGSLWNSDGSRSHGGQNFAPANVQGGPTIVKAGPAADDTDSSRPAAAGGDDDDFP